MYWRNNNYFLYTSRTAANEFNLFRNKLMLIIKIVLIFIGTHNHKKKMFNIIKF